MKHPICPAMRIKSEGLIGLELELPEITIEIPTPAQISKHTAELVAERLKATIRAGQTPDGTPLRTPAASTLERRARDAYPPMHPRSNRWPLRYPGRVAAMLSGKLTPGRVKSRTTKYKLKTYYGFFGTTRTEVVGWKRTTKYKRTSISQLAANDSGRLWSLIRAAAAGQAAEVIAPPDRPIADIERRLGSQVFAATDAHLDAALEDVMQAIDMVSAGEGAAGAMLRKLRA